MEIAAGTRLGPYEIGPMLGAGGMGAVYQARDTRLNRSVAIKVLPASLSSDPQMRERLAREARAISALSHPNICALFDIGSTDGVDYLVMELLDGETVAQRLRGGAMPVPQAVAVAVDIARALDAAHRAGLVHRDLKPGNIMLTRTGARLLDFGLAKAITPASLDVNAPTAAAPLTRDGFMVGTLQYMAPEQIEGRALDSRTDIFAFGLVVYEMLAGRAAFPATSESSVLGAILTAKPVPLTTISSEVSPELERIVDRCLEKNPDDRWQSARDLAEALRWSLTPSGAVVKPALSRSTWFWTAAALIALLGALGAMTVTMLRRRPDTVPRTVRFSIDPPPGMVFEQYPVETELALSPDGKTLAIVAVEGGRRKLFLRPIEALQSHAIEGSDGGVAPFWSPDSQWIGFFAGDSLRKVRASGGPIETICPAQGTHGSWNQHGQIIFSEWGATPTEAVQVVADSGGAKRKVTDEKQGWGLWASFLPDGKHFLFFGLFQDKPVGLYLASLDEPNRSRLLIAGAGRGEVRGENLYYVRDAVLVRQPFDTKRLVLSGEPVPVADPVFVFAPLGTGAFSVSSDASVIAWQRIPLATQLVWRDWNGREVGRVGKPEFYRHFDLSPDGQRLAADIFDRKTQVSNVFIFDLERGVSTRTTSNPNGAYAPLWLRSGKALVLTTKAGNVKDVSDAPNLAVVTLSDGAVRPLREGDGLQYATSITADDRHVVYTISRGPYKEVEMLPLTGEAAFKISTPANHDESDAVVSPDNRWLAFESDESGRPEVYIRPFLRQGEKMRVSREGGTEPQWTADGRRLLFLNPAGVLWRVDVTLGERPRIDAETAMFAVGSAGMMEFSSLGLRHYQVAGDRILVREIPGGADADPIMIMVNATSTPLERSPP